MVYVRLPKIKIQSRTNLNNFDEIKIGTLGGNPTMSIYNDF